MHAKRLFRRLLATWVLLAAVLALPAQAGVLWLVLGSASQPALDAGGAALTLPALRALGIRAYDAAGQALGVADLSGMDAAGPGFFVGVVSVPAEATPVVRLRLGPDADGKTADLGASPFQADGFTPAVDAAAYRVSSATLTWAAEPVLYRLAYLAATHGTILGVSRQSVAAGTSGSAVTASPDTGYHFVAWSDGSVQNPRTDTAVAADITVTAEFAAHLFTVTFQAGSGGRLDGPSSQTVASGGTSVPVTAVAAYGFIFAHWSDGSTANPRSFANVAADHSLTAVFAAAGAVPPQGAFVAMETTDAGSAHGLWDLGGAYVAAVKGAALSLDLTHDTKGKLTGQATYVTANAVTVVMPVKGTVRGAGGTVVMKARMKGADTTRSVAVALALNLTVAPATGQIVGLLTGTVKANGVTTAVAQNLTLDIPAPMDGSWTLTLDLAHNGTGVTGSALLTLSNGAEHALTAKGKAAANDTVLLSLAGDQSDPAAKAIKAKVSLSPLAGGWARIEHLTGKGYGQSLQW